MSNAAELASRKLTNSSALMLAAPLHSTTFRINCMKVTLPVQPP